MNSFFISKIEVGSHLYLKINDNFSFHGETIFGTLFVVFAFTAFFFLATKQLKVVPEKLQTFCEILYEFIRSIAISQLGPSYYKQFLPFVSTLFLFIFGCNWSGTLIPWKILELNEGEFAAPTNDINTTACLAILTSITYFFAGFKYKGLSYFQRYIKPSVFLLPINIIEDFTKPLSLNFRLFGNIVADELTVSVLCSLVPLFIPIPIMLLGLFASSIQALIFSTLASAYIAEVIE